MVVDLVLQIYRDVKMTNLAYKKTNGGALLEHSNLQGFENLVASFNPFPNSKFGTLHPKISASLLLYSSLLSSLEYSEIRDV